VDDGPLAAFAYPDGHRLHDAAAVGGTVAGLFVHMKAGQAVGAMVAVVAACILRGADPSADFAGKGVVAGVCLIVTFFQRSCVCFHDSWYRPPEELCLFVFGRRGLRFCQTSRSAHKLQCKCCMFQKALLMFLYRKIRILGPYERVLKVSSLLPSP